MPDANTNTTGWGLIAGNGRFPFLVLEGARSQGIEMAVIALKEEASPERLQALKRAYRLLVRAKLNTSQALAEMRKSLGDSADVQELIKFIESAERGIVK